MHIFLFHLASINTEISIKIVEKLLENVACVKILNRKGRACQGNWVPLPFGNGANVFILILLFDAQKGAPYSHITEDLIPHYRGLIPTLQRTYSHITEDLFPHYRGLISLHQLQKKKCSYFLDITEECTRFPRSTLIHGYESP